MNENLVNWEREFGELWNANLVNWEIVGVIFNFASDDLFVEKKKSFWVSIGKGLNLMEFFFEGPKQM